MQMSPWESSLQSFKGQCKEKRLTINYQTTWRELHDSLTCGDIRYLDYDEAIMLDIFLLNNAVIKEVVAFSISQPMTDPREKFYGNNVQKPLKAVLTEILGSNGFTIDGYELDCSAGQADLLAHKDDLRVVGECGACRITKVFEALLLPPFVLQEENVQLWHMPYPSTSGESGTSIITGEVHIYKRGTNWKKLYSLYKRAQYAGFEKVYELMSKGLKG